MNYQRRDELLALLFETKRLLSKDAIIAIENARKRIKAGKFVTEEEAKNRLGF